MQLRLRNVSFYKFKAQKHTNSNMPAALHLSSYTIDIIKPPHLLCIERTLRRRQNILLSDLNIADDNSIRCDVPSVNYECHSQDH